MAAHKEAKSIEVNLDEMVDALSALTPMDWTDVLE
jgi:hypothetical protein